MPVDSQCNQSINISRYESKICASFHQYLGTYHKRIYMWLAYYRTKDSLHLMNTTNPILFSIDLARNWIGYFKQNDKLRRFIAWKSFDTVSKWILVTWFTGSGNFAMLGNLFGCGLYFPGLANKSVLHRKIPTNFLLSFLVGFNFFLSQSMIAHFDLQYNI